MAEIYDQPCPSLVDDLQVSDGQLQAACGETGKDEGWNEGWDESCGGGGWKEGKEIPPPHMYFNKSILSYAILGSSLHIAIQCFIINCSRMLPNGG
jgi:hypothetical protein